MAHVPAYTAYIYPLMLVANNNLVSEACGACVSGGLLGLLTLLRLATSLKTHTVPEKFGSCQPKHVHELQGAISMDPSIQKGNGEAVAKKEGVMFAQL